MLVSGTCLNAVYSICGTQILSNHATKDFNLQNIRKKMYELDLTRQNFDFWIGVVFLSDNATKPEERAPEMWQRNRTSTFRRI